MRLFTEHHLLSERKASPLASYTVEFVLASKFIESEEVSSGSQKAEKKDMYGTHAQRDPWSHFSPFIRGRPYKSREDHIKSKYEVNNMEKLMTTQEVADYLDFKKETIWAWARNGLIPYHRVGGRFRFDRRKIDRWLEKGEVPV